MKTRLVCAPLFLFALAAPVFSQQNLVRLDDDKNPCRRFKMIVLVPAATALRIKASESLMTPLTPKWSGILALKVM